MRYLYEYWESNDWCKFIDVNIYKITEDHPVAVNHLKNRLEVVGFGHLSLGGSIENFSICIFPYFPAVIKNWWT